MNCLSKIVQMQQINTIKIPLAFLHHSGIIFFEYMFVEVDVHRFKIFSSTNIFQHITKHVVNVGKKMAQEKATYI